MHKASFLIIILFLILPFAFFSQKLKPMNLATFNQKKYHFGFGLGFNSSNFILNRFERSKYPEDSILSIESYSRPSFNLGILASYRFSRLWTLRFIPSLNFSEKQVVYKLDKKTEKPEYTKNVTDTYLSIPILFKYKSERLNNSAAYIIFGGSYNYNFTSNKNVNNRLVRKLDDIVLKFNPHELGGEIGAGFDFFFPYFKMSLELKLIFFTINSLDKSDNTIFSRSIESLRNNIYVFTIYFEGGRKY